MMRQQQMNGGMSAAEGAPDLMQRLARLPTPPDVGPLRRRYLSPFPLCHKHHLMKTTRFRWCCIDLLNSPGISDSWPYWYRGKYASHQSSPATRTNKWQLRA